MKLANWAVPLLALLAGGSLVPAEAEAQSRRAEQVWQRVERERAVRNARRDEREGDSRKRNGRGGSVWGRDVARGSDSDRDSDSDRRRAGDRDSDSDREWDSDRDSDRTSRASTRRGSVLDLPRSRERRLPDERLPGERRGDSEDEPWYRRTERMLGTRQLEDALGRIFGG